MLYYTDYIHKVCHLYKTDCVLLTFEEKNLKTMNPFNWYAQDIALFAWYRGININIYLYLSVLFRNLCVCVTNDQKIGHIKINECNTEKASQMKKDPKYSENIYKVLHLYDYVVC